MAHGQISELSKIAPLKPYVDDLQSAVDGVSSKMAKISKELEKVNMKIERYYSHILVCNKRITRHLF